MRLPARSPQQIKTENTRALHEDLWRAYIRPELGRVFIASPEMYAAQFAKSLVDSLHRFWLSRGYRIRVKQNRDQRGFNVWLEVKKPKSKHVEAA